MYEKKEEYNSVQEETKTGFTKGFFIGLVGAALSIVALLVPFASKSIVGITMDYLSFSAREWGDLESALFYKLFMCAVIGCVILFALMYIRANVMERPGKMLFWTILTVIIYQVLKYDFADRGVVPGNFDRGVAFVLIWIVYVLMIVGAAMRKVKK